MKFFLLFVLSVFFLPAYSTHYSCDIFNNGQKITTLPGAVPDNNRIASAANHNITDPNITLAYTLCQQAGFRLINTQVAIPGMRSNSNVTKIQQTPDPACSLKCSPIS